MVALPTSTTAQYGWAGSMVSVKVVVAASASEAMVQALQPVGGAAMGAGGVPFAAISWPLHKTSVVPHVEPVDVPNAVRAINPTGTITNVNFGRITAVQEPRIMQFAIKYVF